MRGRDEATAATPEATAATARHARWRELGPLLVIAAAVVAGNALYVFGVFNPNPINYTSELGTIVHAGLLLGTFTIDPNSGTTAQALGHLSALDILHGHIPWWNPFEGIGAPLAGEMQAAALFPLTLLLAFSTGQLPFHMVLELVSGVATYRLLVRLDVARWIAVGAGCAFALNGTFSWFEHAPVNPIAFLPLLLLGIERARDAATTGGRHRWALIAVAVALSLYAGFPETAYLDGLLAVLWTVARAWRLSGAQLAHYARKLVAGAIVGVMIAAPIVVAFADYERTAFLGGHGTGFDNVALPHAAISSLLFPYVFGPIFGFATHDKTGVLDAIWGSVGGYVTTSVLVLGVVALYSRRLRALRAVLVVWIVFAFGRIYGIEPFQRLFDLLPDMHQVAAYRYLPASMELAALCLAALAIDDIRRRSVPMWYVLAAIAGAAVLALVALDTGRGLITSIKAAPNDHLWVEVSLVWGFGIVALIGIGAVALRGRGRVALLVTCVALDALAMFVVPDFSAPRKATIDTGIVHWLERHIGTERFYTLAPFRPEYGSYFGIGEADVNDLPLPKRYTEYIDTHLDTNVIPNVFVGFTQRNPTGPTPLQELVRNEANYEAIGVKYVLATPGTIPAVTVTALHATLVHTDKLVAVYQLPAPAPLYSIVRGSCTLSHQTVNGVTADCQGPATIVRRELYMPGWSALAGGSPETVKLSGPLFQKVRVPSGHARVRFAFVPPHERTALGALLAGFVLLLLGWWLGATGRLALPRLRRRRASSPAP